MGEVTFELPIPDAEGNTTKTIVVDDNTEAIVLSNQELSRAVGRLAAKMVVK